MSRIQSMQSAISKSRNRCRGRKLFLEALEDRRLMAVDWRNPADSLDVNQDGFIVPQDALIVINRVNDRGAGALPAEKPPQENYHDVNGDGVLAPLDALRVVNWLNENTPGARVLNESSDLASQSEITITVGQTVGARKYQLGLDVEFDTTDTSAVVEDVFSVYLVQADDASVTLLDRGHTGTALFQLQGSRVEQRGGITSWNGETLEIDLSSVSGLDTATMVLQLINHDNDQAGRVTVTSISNVVNETEVPATADSPLLQAAGPGAEVAAELAISATIEPQLENIRFDSATGRYAADVRLLNSTSTAVSKASVAFMNLPAGVTLHNASGTTESGFPYINMEAGMPGGLLRAGATSERVLVELNNAGGIQFIPQLQVFVETPQINNPPTLPPIGTITVNPGGFFSHELNATDPDGDFITYAIASTTGILPTGALKATGTLSFEPTVDELGTYQFDVVASDGESEVRQPVTVIVENDPSANTRISGFVRNTRGEPLPGIVVAKGAASSVTAEDGSFTIDFGAILPGDDPIVVHGEAISGVESYSRYEILVNGLFERPFVLGENNHLDRPIYLSPMSLESATQVVHSQETIVTNPNLPDAALTVFANSVFAADGQPYSGPIMLAEVPHDRTLIELPEVTRPGKAYTILPAGLKFTHAPLLSLPKSDAGASPEEPTQICESLVQKRLHPKCGGVNAGPTPIEPTNPTGYDIHYITIKDSWVPIAVPQQPECDPCEPELGGRPGAGSPPSLFPKGRSKAEREVNGYEADNRTHETRLVYDSERADPLSVLRFGLQQMNGGDLERLLGQLTVLLGGFEMQLGEQFWKLPVGATSAEAALMADLGHLVSGSYPYRLTSANARVGFGSGVTTTTTGTLFSVNSRQSPFGSGWGLAGWQEIIKNKDGSALLVDGNGSRLNFAASSDGKFDSPPADFSILETLLDGTFRRTMPNQTVYSFNAAGKLASVTDSTGYQKKYGYMASGQLEKVMDGGGRATTFTYSGNRIATITDPAGRITKLTHDQNGNLVKIEYSDGAAENWEYDTRHLMTAQVGPLGERTELEYDLAGRVTGMTRPDGSEVELSPTGSAGVAAAAQTHNPMNAPVTVQKLPAFATHLDGNGKISSYDLDDIGQFSRGSDAFDRRDQFVRDRAGRGKHFVQSANWIDAAASARRTHASRCWLSIRTRYAESHVDETGTPASRRSASIARATAGIAGRCPDVLPGCSPTRRSSRSIGAARFGGGLPASCDD